jgi:ribosomal protein L37AE/L43A
MATTSNAQTTLTSLWFSSVGAFQAVKDKRQQRLADSTHQGECPKCHMVTEHGRSDDGWETCLSCGAEFFSGTD